jgi:hypothetical protein
MKRAWFLLLTSIILITGFPRTGFTYGLRSEFSQDHKTYSWNFNFSCDPDTASTFSWGLSSYINSTLTKRSDGPDWSQEDGKLSLTADYRLNNSLRGGGFFSQDIYSSEETKATTSDYGIRSDLTLGGILFSQSLGVKTIDNKFSSYPELQGAESGVCFDQTISVFPRILPQSVTEISLNQTIVEMERIPTSKRGLNLSFSRCLSNAGSIWEADSLRVIYREEWAKKKFFSGKTQKKSHRDINLYASKKVPLGFNLTFSFDYLYDRDRRYLAGQDALDFFLLSGSLIINLHATKSFWQRLEVEGFYKYMHSEWDYLNEESDQSMEGGELGGRLTAEITQADSLQLTGSIGVTSFFAPISGQFNDRDKLTVLVWGEYVHIFSPYLIMRLEGGFKKFHLIYMSEQFSFENNNDQTYLLSPTLIWLPHSKLTLKQVYSIKANYRYYDHQKASETGRNSLFRRASSASEIIYRYNRRVTFLVNYSYRYEDDGPLIWRDQWVQKISRDQRTNALNLSVDYKPSWKITISPKYTYEERKSWNHEAEEIVENEEMTVEERRILGSRFSRNMISISFQYLVNQDNFLYLAAAHRLQDVTQRKREVSDYVTVSIARVF